jgi:hypothetical protein
MGTAIDTSFGPEWALMELLCLGTTTPERVELLAELVRGDLDWGEVIEQCLRHRMLTLVAHEVIGHGLADVPPLRVAEHLRSVRALNLHRRQVWYSETKRVVRSLEARGVAVAARKGAAYESTLYGGNGSRWLGDIDLLIRPTDRDLAMTAMSELDYQIGLYDFDSGRIVPFERAELMRYRLNPDHLPTHSHITGDPLVRVIEVDLANSLTWARGRYQVPVDRVLDEIEYVPVAGIRDLDLPCPAPTYQFLDTILHLFREAWFEWWLSMEQDVDLMKFGDVIRLWEAHREQLVAGDFAGLVTELGVAEPVCWVLEHLARTFPVDAISELCLDGRVDEEYLNSAGASGGATRSWQGTMRDRLRVKNRQRVFAVETE